MTWNIEFGLRTGSEIKFQLLLQEEYRYHVDTSEIFIWNWKATLMAIWIKKNN